MHLIKDRTTLSELLSHSQQGSQGHIDPKHMEHPVLLSMYAETLRFGVQIHIPRNSPHANLHIGQKIIPRNKTVLLNTWIAHTDKKVWNTSGGQHPLESFWAGRFLIDPNDPQSGPVRRSSHDLSKDLPKDKFNSMGPSFSTEGLEGAWIPFGGKSHGKVPHL